jgi:F0F1-type ATP synthase assembly protein I
MALRQTLLPQYSLRQILLVMTGCGVVFLAFSFAVRGAAWAVGIAVGVLSIVLAMLVYAAFFGLIWALAQAGSRFGRQSTTEERG